MKNDVDRDAHDRQVIENARTITLLHLQALQQSGGTSRIERALARTAESALTNLIEYEQERAAKQQQPTTYDPNIITGFTHPISRGGSPAMQIYNHLLLNHSGEWVSSSTIMRELLLTQQQFDEAVEQLIYRSPMIEIDTTTTYESRLRAIRPV